MANLHSQYTSGTQFTAGVIAGSALGVSGLNPIVDRLNSISTDNNLVSGTNLVIHASGNSTFTGEKTVKGKIRFYGEGGGGAVAIYHGFGHAPSSITTGLYISGMEHGENYGTVRISIDPTNEATYVLIGEDIDSGPNQSGCVWYHMTE